MELKYIDISFDVQTDSHGKEPDSASETLKHTISYCGNLVYTGITRAKKIGIIVGTTKALAYSIHNMVVQKRNTRLKERLSQ